MASAGDGHKPDSMVWEGDEVVLDQCAYCARLSRLPGPGQVCQAFPGSIPDAILANRADHRKPYTVDGEPADLGVSSDVPLLFSPREGVPAESLERLYRALDSLPSR